MFTTIGTTCTLVWLKNSPANNSRCGCAFLISSIIGTLALDGLAVGVPALIGMFVFLHILPFPLVVGGVLVGFAGSYLLTSVFTVPLAFLGFIISDAASSKCYKNFHKINREDLYSS